MSMSSYGEVLQARSRPSRLCLPIAKSSEREVFRAVYVFLSRSLPSAMSSELSMTYYNEVFRARSLPSAKSSDPSMSSYR